MSPQEWPPEKTNQDPRSGGGYAEDYTTKLKKLLERIAATKDILTKARTAQDVEMAGALLRQQSEALRKLKIDNGIPLNEDEKLAA